MTNKEWAGSFAGEIRLENPRSGIPRIRHRAKRNPDVHGESGHRNKLENTGLANRSPILPWLRQLLQTVHPRLFPGGSATNRINQKNREVDIEPRSGEYIRRTKKALYDSTNFSPF